ncbi:MAG: hypothetical protein EOM93_00720 [Gammaproteobacteria bacterium]|nr:hypothetical protein [Gammaproteobacteria bacterium]
MDTLTFKVVPDVGNEVTAEQADLVIKDVQSMLSHIGMFIVTAEMGLQGKAPEGFGSKFDLGIEPRERRPDENSLLNVALVKLEETLDVAGSDIINRWLSENYTDPRYRAAVAKDLMKLCVDLEGCRLSYGRGRRMRELFNARPERFGESAGAETRTFTCALAGAVCRKSDMKGRNAYYLDSGDRTSKITTGKDFPERTADSYSRAGPCLVSGMAVLDDEENIVEVRDVCGVSDFPGIVFKRIITPDSDLALLNPMAADVSFDRNTRKWTLTNDLVGISASKPNWNEAVAAFHDYFMFLWETYVERSKGGLSEEEKEIRDYLLSLVPF